MEKEEVRPLVLLTPKSLLRNPNVASSADQFTQGHFKPILEEPKTGQDAEKVERLIFCTGKMAIDLHETINDDMDTSWLHIVRVEEIYPFPEEEIQEVISRYNNVKEVVWVQEEPSNMGAWTYIQSLLRQVAPEGADVSYIGRRRRSSPSEGDPKVHKKEQSRIINEALNQKSEGGPK